MYDLTYLNKVSDNDQDFILEILSNFINNGEELLAFVDKLWAEENYDQLSRMVHKFIPSLKFIGAENFKPDLKQLEIDLVTHDNLNEIENHLMDLKINLNVLLNQIKSDFDLKND